MNEKNNYNIDRPKGKESFIRHTNFKEDKPSLFPIEVLIKGLECDEMTVEYKLQSRIKGTDDYNKTYYIGVMECFN